MGHARILLGGDWNAHSDRCDPQYQPTGGAGFFKNLMDEYDSTDVTYGVATHMNLRNVKTLESLIDVFMTKALMANQKDICTDLPTTLDHAIVSAHL